jgi:hypothetical protein
MLVFNKYFHKNKKLKLYFGDRVAVLNDFIYQTGGSIPAAILPCASRSQASEPCAWKKKTDVRKFML